MFKQCKKSDTGKHEWVRENMRDTNVKPGQTAKHRHVHYCRWCGITR